MLELEPYRELLAAAVDFVVLGCPLADEVYALVAVLSEVGVDALQSLLFCAEDYRVVRD
jgi:hypothetical protein